MSSDRKIPPVADSSAESSNDVGPPADIVRSWRKPVLRRFPADAAGTRRAGSGTPPDGGAGAHRLS